MEENQVDTQTEKIEKAEEVQETQNPTSSVSFPTVGQSQKAGGGKTLLALGILALIGVLGYFIFKSASGNKPEATPTPVESIAPAESVAPTESAKPEDKSKVKIQVQNGTGITGEAAYLQTQLKNLGYTNVTVGNASTQDATATTVTFTKNLSSSVVDEITKKLKELYKEVETKTTSSTTTDVVIVTGLRKGATSKPSASPTVKASATPAATGTSSASPTPTPTATAQ